MIILSPSLLSVDFAHIADGIAELDRAKVPALHLDVMDGAFVPNISFGAPVIKCLRKETDMIFDVHLMIENPDQYIGDFVTEQTEYITVHQEACRHINRTVQHIRSMDVKPGVAINPGTPVSALEYVLEDADLILIMSVNPGFGGQKFIPSAIRKAQELKGLREKYGLDFRIEIDGGINLANVKTVIDAGVEIIVAGSSVFKAEDVPARVQEFLDIFENRE